MESGAHVGQRRPGRPPVAMVVAVAAVVIALSALWAAGESHYRSCLQRAAVKYPAVPVSAFVGSSKRDVGPLKVSYAKERSAAAESCHRFF